jgi:hypothetical protein
VDKDADTHQGVELGVLDYTRMGGWDHCPTGWTISGPTCQRMARAKSMCYLLVNRINDGHSVQYRG